MFHIMPTGRLSVPTGPVTKQESEQTGVGLQTPPSPPPLTAMTHPVLRSTSFSHKYGQNCDMIYCPCVCPMSCQRCVIHLKALCFAPVGRKGRRDRFKRDQALLDVQAACVCACGLKKKKKSMYDTHSAANSDLMVSPSSSDLLICVCV